MGDELGPPLQEQVMGHFEKVDYDWTIAVRDGVRARRVCLIVLPIALRLGETSAFDRRDMRR